MLDQGFLGGWGLEEGEEGEEERSYLASPTRGMVIRIRYTDSNCHRGRVDRHRQRGLTAFLSAGRDGRRWRMEAAATAAKTLDLREVMVSIDPSIDPSMADLTYL